MSRFQISGGDQHMTDHLVGILHQWSSFQITEEKEEWISASDEVVDKGQRLIQTGLVGKLLTSRLVNKTAFMDTVRQLWQVKGLKIKVLAQNHFLFTFPDEAEIERLLAMEPWNHCYFL